MPAIADIPVIVMTGMNGVSVPKQRGNIVATLWKPFTWEELFDVVRTFAPLGEIPCGRQQESG